MVNLSGPAAILLLLTPGRASVLPLRGRIERPSDPLLSLAWLHELVRRIKTIEMRCAKIYLLAISTHFLDDEMGDQTVGSLLVRARFRSPIELMDTIDTLSPSDLNKLFELREFTTLLPLLSHLKFCSIACKSLTPSYSLESIWRIFG